MTTIRWGGGHGGFKGTMPRQSPADLPGGFAQQAFDADLLSHEIRSAPECLHVAYASKGANVKAIFPYQGRWLNWLTDVNVAHGFASPDPTERIYWTGDGYPKKGDNSTLLVTGDPPSGSFRMGIKAPASVPQVSATGAGSGGTELRKYVFTFVTGWNEEGQPSVPSAGITVNKVGAAVTISMAGEPAPDPSYNIVGVNVYRTVSIGGAEDDYQLINPAPLPLAQTTFLDTQDSGNLIRSLTTQDFDEPPATMIGLIEGPNGMLAAIDPLARQILFCEPFIAHAWPKKYRKTLPHNPIGLGVFGTTFLVATDAIPAAFTGVSPDSMQEEKLLLRAACVSKRSIVSGAFGVLWASNDGLFLVGPGALGLQTKQFLTVDEWKPLNPSSIWGVIRDNKYYGWFDATGTGAFQGFIFDAQEPDNGLTFTVDSHQCGYSDIGTDSLYLSEAGDIHLWWGDPRRFRATTYQTDDRQVWVPTAMGACEIRGNFAANTAPAGAVAYLSGAALTAYNAALAVIAAFDAAIEANTNREPGALDEHAVNGADLGGDGWYDPLPPALTGFTVEVYGDDVLLYSTFVSSQTPFRLPSSLPGKGPNTARAKQFSVRIVGVVRIQQIALGTSIDALKERGAPQAAWNA